MILVIELQSESRFYQKPVFFTLKDGILKLVDEAIWLPKGWAEKFLLRTPKIGVEGFKKNTVVRGLRDVKAGEPEYLEAWRQEFEREGFYTEIVDEKRAKLWENIRGSGLDKDIQDAVVFGLKRLSDEAVDNIQKELEDLLK